jgi:epsilon-lactone hydrolase
MVEGKERAKAKVSRRSSGKKLKVDGAKRSQTAGGVDKSLDVEYANVVVSTYELSQIPTLLVTTDLKVVAANRIARTSRQRDPVFVVVAGRLSFRNPKMSLELSKALSRLQRENEVSDHEGAASKMFPPMGDDQVSIVPKEIVRLSGKPLILLQIVDRQAEVSFRLEDLMNLGLTARESEVALRLYCGDTISDFANASGLAITTVRTHLQNAMRKLNVTKQAQLVARLATIFARQ